MARRPRTTRPPARGICLIEMLIALAITAVLLVAVAAAFDASFSSYNQNTQIADAVNTSRVLAYRIMTQARRSSYLNVADSGLRIEVEDTNEDYQYIYVYQPAEQRVNLSRMNLQDRTVENLGTVDSVVAFQIPREQWGENPARLSLSMTVRAGANSSTISTSAVPRSTVAF